jgi:hypothetical protein
MPANSSGQLCRRHRGQPPGAVQTGDGIGDPGHCAEPDHGYENAAKTALPTGKTIAETTEALGIMSSEEMIALLVPENLTQPIRLVARTAGPIV